MVRSIIFLLKVYFGDFGGHFKCLKLTVEEWNVNVGLNQGKTKEFIPGPGGVGVCWP
jgi:hypothetical protein